MEAIIDIFLSFLLLYQYTALFLIAFIAALIVPLPSSSMLFAASAFASQGYMNFTLVLLVAYAGNVAGDNVGYFLARRYGKKAVQRIGLHRALQSNKYQVVEGLIQTNPRAIIFFSRFFTGVCPAVNILTGVARVQYHIFLVFDLIGEAAYVLVYGLAGYLLGTQWENSFDFFLKGGILVISLGVFIALTQHFYFNRRRS